LPIGAGQPAPGDYPGVVVGTLELRRAVRAADLDVAVHVAKPANDDLTLLGYSQNQDEVAPGEGVMLTIGWQARQRPQKNYTASLELIAPDGHAVAQWSFAPGGEDFPTSEWRTGETVISRLIARVAPRTGAGQHTWRVKLTDAAQSASLGTIEVNPPERTFALPPGELHRLDARLGDWAELAGFSAPELVEAGQSMSVKLVWHALRETEQDYKAFVHLLDANGQVVAQSDATPAGWTRPTTGWQAGEFVTDVHTLGLRTKLPPGEYRLAAGMYDASGRLAIAGGGDVIQLGLVQVSALE
jgi:hypothetical protein